MDKDKDKDEEDKFFSSGPLNLMEVLPKILYQDTETFKMRPSEFIKEMNAKLDERHKQLVALTLRQKTTASDFPPQFKVVPGMLVFQKYELLTTSHLILEVRNVGKTSVGIKMHCPPSIYFSATFANKPITKLAPGLNVEYKVSFTPQELVDYQHRLVFTSNDCTFQVPLLAIGPRPMLDIPDQIILGPAPVKISTNKFIVVRNIGDATAVFNFSTGRYSSQKAIKTCSVLEGDLPVCQSWENRCENFSKHFQLIPAKGILAPQESMMLNLTFFSTKVKQVNETLYLMLETGEKLWISLHGSAENVSIRLDKSSVVHEDTFIGLKRCKSIRLINNSSSVVKFCWKKNKSLEEDLNIIKSMREKYKEMAELEILKDMTVEYFGLANHENHKRSCERILKDELKLLEKEEFKFSNEIFTLLPESGEIWPKDSKEIIVSFGPKVCGSVQAEAYLEVTGRDARLPLKIKGCGLGPDISLNVKMLDIDYIYLCSLHRYEVLAENKGDIPGTIEYVSQPLIFGGKVNITPKVVRLKAYEVGVFVLSYTSNRPGEFTENMNFVIKESQKELTLTMKGKIVCPTLHFDRKDINFGSIPFGISVTREATLNNLSVVPVTFSLKVSPDGVDPSISHDEFAKFTTKPAIPQYPKEFEVEPEESLVEPYSSKKVKVTVTANKVGSFRKVLIVDMWDSENGSVSCPIHYRVEVANLVGDPDTILIPFCFINYPYTRSITLKNLSRVAGLFHIVPFRQNSELPVTYTANLLQGVIPPYRSLKIDVTLLISAVGRQVFPISLMTFGSEMPQDICMISCLGQGPIIHVEPTSLNWGQQPLLVRSQKTVTLTNVSPIPATLDICLAKATGFWSVSHPQVKILPEEALKVTVALLLNECGKFKDNLKVNIYNGKDLSVPLTAIGVGSSLLMTPRLGPVYDLGMLFCHKKYEFQIVVENKGTKSYGLLWSPYVEYKTFVNAKFSLPEDSIFRIEPIKMDILPGETKIMTVEAFSKSLGYFSQSFYCFANSGSPTKKLQYTTEVSARFVGPTITFDKEEINFWHYTGADGREEKLHDTVLIKNVSILPVQVQLSTASPFCLVSETGTCVNVLRVGLEGFEKKLINLKFLAPQNFKKYYKVYTAKLIATMNDTSKTSSVVLRGEVSYPNISIKPVKADFRYVKVGTNACIEINLMNTSPLTVYYDIKWKKQMCQVVHIENRSSATLFNEKTKESLIESPDKSKENDIPQEPEKSEPEVVPIGTPVTPNILNGLSPPEKPVLKMPEVEISNSDVKELLYDLTRGYQRFDSEELLEVYKMAPWPSKEIDPIVQTCNQYCVITPFYGKLEPFCSQVLYIGFCSDTPIKVHLEALIQIRSGPTEILMIDAISGDIDYRLSTTELDFGKQLFCETQSQALKIRNTSEMPFNFETYTVKLECEEGDNFSLGQGVVTISPNAGTLNSYQTAELVVRYHPGVPGKFETVFRLRIGHLSPIVIKVRGIGVFPQVYIFLPRPEILKISPEIGYLAVASITPDWVLTEYGGPCMYDLNQLKPYRSRESSLCDLEEEDSLGESWEVIRAQEYTPSEIDIHLAIERILAYDLIAEDTNNTSFAVYARTIPRFTVPGYELDFGVCVIGRTVEKQVTIMNFGPLTAILYGIFSINLKDDGIHVRLKNRNELKVGACLPFTVAFNPKRAKYKKKYELIKSIFYFEIYHGPKIPVRISAEVTYPHVQPSMFLINFREVICGQCKVINLRLKNPGLVRARWTLLLKSETIHNGTVSELSTLNPMFSLDCNSGVLNPSEYCTVQVYFKPGCGNSFSACLLVQVVKSLETLKIQVLGTGIEPRLHISNYCLNFSSALPFPYKEEAIFSVENPSPFPVEFFFPEFDEQVYEEEKMIRAVALYYQTDELLFPVRRPGDSLPPEIIDFYNLLLDGLNAKFMEEEKERMLAEREGMEESAGVSMFSIEEDAPVNSWHEQATEYSKRKKKHRKSSRSGTALESSRDHMSGTSVSKEPIPPTIFESRTSCEIEDMLQDFIKTNLVNKALYDPIQAALKSVLPPVVEEEQKDGTLIICHGAPYTNSVLLASRLAISINTMSLSIDRMVLTEAALGRCEAGNTARELIEQAYWEYVEVEKKEPVPTEEWGESPLPSEVLSFDGNYEELQRKFKALIELRESAGRGKSTGPGTAKSETSKRVEKGSSPLKPPTSLLNAGPILPEDLVFEILKYRLALEVKNGLIVEGLESMIISSTTKALVLLLKAVGNIKDIIVIFFLNDYIHYVRNMTIRHSEQELAKSYLREEILNVLEEEPEEAFKSLNLDEADEDTFRAFFITKRHEAQVQFEKKREFFFDPKRAKMTLKPESPKQIQPEQIPLLQMSYASQLTSTEKKQKDSGRKKDARGTSKLSEVNWKEEGDLKSGKSKRDMTEAEFLTFEMDLIEMRAIIENWDQRLGAIVADSALDVKTRKGQTPRKNESVMTKVDTSKKGAFLWLVDVSKPHGPSFMACCNYLKAILETRQNYSESDDWPQDSDTGMTFSIVVSRPRKPKPPLQNVFFLAPLHNAELVGEYEGESDYPTNPVPPSNEKLNRSMSSISVKNKRKPAGGSKRGKPDSRMSTDAKSSRVAYYSSTDAKSLSRGVSCNTSVSPPKSQTNFSYYEMQMKSRWILGPGEKQNFKVRYFPTEMGTWEHKYIIRMVSWGKKESIHCFGVCDIPRIDMRPEVLFTAVEHFRPLTSKFVPAFYYSFNAYDFGSIIVLQLNDAKKISKKTTILHICNISTLPIDMCIVLEDEDMAEEPKHTDSIRIEPSKLWIEPGGKREVLVTVVPTKYGPMSKSVLFIIKNNPKVEKITVMYEGVKANVSMSPKVVNFDRQLLQRQETRNIVFTNENTIELCAALKLPPNFPSQFSFSHMTVWLPPMGSFTIEVRYNATEVQTIHEKPVLVQIFDSEYREDPVQELTFYMHAEAYDAALDIIFSKQDEDHIDFGDIRVENYYTVEFFLKNVGKYLLGYKIEIDRSIGPEADLFHVNPQIGRLHPAKVFPVTVTVMVQDEVSWKRLPFIRVVLVEPFYGDEEIANIPISVSARSHFARYEIRPSNQLSFGHVPVRVSVTGSILIENKGLFSLSYFVDLQSTNMSEGSPVSSKKSSKVSAVDKSEKGKKAGNSVFRAGIFEISPGVGTVEPKQTAVVKVTSNPNEVKNHEEKIVIYIDESLPHLKNGNPLTISAQACLPKIRYQDYKSVFKEHHVCKDESELNARVKAGSYTVFAENNNLFSFKNICVNTTAEARLHLENDGLIDCTLTAVVKSVSDEDSSKRPSTEGAHRNFGLSPEKVIIEPYNSACLLLTFRPEALEVYKAQVMITVEMPEGYENEVHMFKVWGNGIFPQIEITEPNAKLPEGQTLVNFPPTSPGHTSTSLIAFSNTGLLDCKVIIELYKFQLGVFTLWPRPETERMLKIWDPTKPIDHTAVVSLSPGEEAEFTVCFNPKEVETYSSQVKLFIVDNPFENWCYKLMGEVFFEEVVIERIRTGMPFLVEDGGTDKSAIPIAPGQYYVNFADCYVNKKSKVLLRLANKTAKEYFKFEWEEIPSIYLSPNVGHLYPNSYKEILLVFLPEEPMELEDLTVTCKLNKILLEKPFEPSWDSRLLQFHLQPKLETTSARSTDRPSFLANTESMKAITEEPVHEVIPESNKMLYVNVSAIADYTKLTCETTKIFFKNTYMFQTRIYPLVLENSGNVSLEYKLSLKTVTVWPLKYNKRSQVDEQAILRSLMHVNRPSSSIPVSDCPKTASVPCGKRRRPVTSIVSTKREPLDDCEQEPVGTCTEGDKPYFNPFAIENSVGRIQPKEKASCNLVFSPMDTNEYKAVITIKVDHLHPECTLPEIEVTASSVMPYCHFDVPESDYLRSGRRDYSRPGPVGYAPGVPLNPDTRTIEVKVIGIGATVPIKFHVINPTEEDYTFSWVNITQVQPGVVPSFHCSTLGGQIRAGRQQLMVFSFKSQKVGITESFWKFSIPEHGIETPFLLVGDAREPAIYFLSNHLNLRPMFIGSSSSDVLTLVNNEDTTFEFHFIHESLFCEGRQNSLRVEPSCGIIAPNSELRIRVSYTGKSAGRVVFKVKCKVRSIKELFLLSVEAVTYLVQPVIAFEDLKNVKHVLDLESDNVIDFGSELVLNTTETITLNFTNLSKTAFNYEWEFDTRILDINNCKITFSPKSGYVTSRGKSEISIVFTKKSSITDFPLRLRIQRGPTYNFLVNASASSPLCDLSFTSFDFGYCFIQEKDICFNETTLVIKNKNERNLFLECSLPEDSRFSFFLNESTVPPKGEINITLRFHPTECCVYESQFKIIINGTRERIVELKGEGTDFKVVLADPEDLTISLGAVRVGRSSTRKFTLVNESLAAATLLVGFSDQLPVSGMILLRPQKSFVDLSLDHRLTGVLTISPSTVFRIKPQERCTIYVTYTPQEKSPPFSETVSMQCQEKSEPLCVLTGCCLAPEISLDRQALNFGAVVQSCKAELKLKLVNSGSIGASFEWNVKDLVNYHVSPVQGYCSPESEVTITVVFNPVAIKSCIKKMLECKLSLPDNEKHPSLWLELIGDCVALPQPKEIITFECTVRECVSRELEISNTSGSEWQLVPVVSGEFFKGDDALIVPPLSSVKYKVDYCPMTMSHANPHKGSVFFKLPSGQGILYQFKGIASPPTAEDTIRREIPCKTKYVELLKIKNWLQSPQRFAVLITCMDNQEDPTVFCHGFEHLEVPALAQKEYSLNFFAYNVGYHEFNVHFVNEETKEYAWYSIAFKVHNCGPLELITLKSGVRQLCEYELKLENPLKKPVKYEMKTTSPDIRFQTPLQEVPAQGSAYVTLSYVPIHPGERTESLTASCPELGVFPRELRLVAVELQPSQPRTFETTLGGSDKQEIPVQNISSTPAVFDCEILSEDFTVAEHATAAPGETKNIEVTYEPSEIGSSVATLTVKSEQAGNFTFPLSGFCLKPLAKGPFVMKLGAGVYIPFKNVFKTPKEFHMYVDNPAFVLKTAQETLMPKEEYKIYVGLQKMKHLENLTEYSDTFINPKFPMMGQLIVDCFSPYVKWQFYLKGILEK